MNVAGLADNRRCDGRIFISSRAQFWTERQLIGVYLHEVAHRLADMDHGPIFFCVLCALHERAGIGLESLQLYDFKDQPDELKLLSEPQWRCVVLGFCLVNCQILARSELPAENIAAQARKLWDAHVAQRDVDALAGEQARLNLSSWYQVGRFIFLNLNRYGPLKASGVVWLILMSCVVTQAAIQYLLTR